MPLEGPSDRVELRSNEEVISLSQIPATVEEN